MRDNIDLHVLAKWKNRRSDESDAQYECRTKTGRHVPSVAEASNKESHGPTTHSAPVAGMADDALLQVALYGHAISIGDFDEANRIYNALYSRRAKDAEMTDEERLDWLVGKLFVSTWNGVVGAGAQTNWRIAPDYRHAMQHFTGETLRDAIDAARAIEAPLNEKQVGKS